MPTPIPAPTYAEETGLSDATWITDVRDALRDNPAYYADTWTADGTNGVVGAAALPVKVSHVPVYDSTSTILVRDNTGAQNYTAISSGTPSATQVLVNFNTGEFTFSAAPTTGHAMQFSYQYVKWTDSAILTALYAGVRALYPRVFKSWVDSSISIQVNTWDYNLPVWAQDPRARVQKVEVMDPYLPQTEPWNPLTEWELVGNLLHLPTATKFSPVARLRVTGISPYITLGDLEPQLYHLPIWYALSVLLPKQESYRLRQDTLVPMAQEGGQQPGLLTQTGDYYARRFELELDRLSRVAVRGWGMAIKTVYGRRAQT